MEGSLRFELVSFVNNRFVLCVESPSRSEHQQEDDAQKSKANAEAMDVEGDESTQHSQRVENEAEGNVSSMQHSWLGMICSVLIFTKLYLQYRRSI